MANAREEVGKALEVFSQQNGYGLKKESSLTYKLLVDGNRREKMKEAEKLLEKFGFKVRYVNNMSISSLGHFEINEGIRVAIKPKNRQGMNSAGLANESAIIDAVNQQCKDGPINIRFIPRTGKNWEVLGVSNCKEMGRDTAGRKKADFILETTSGRNYPVSLKKVGAENVESCDVYAGEIAKKVLDRALAEKKTSIGIKSENEGEIIYRIEPNIGWRATQTQVKELCFGSDILPYGCVMVATFGMEVMTYNDKEDIWECKVEHMFYSPEEFKGDYAIWFILRNDSDRNNKRLGYRGLRILSVYESRINQNVVRINGI